MTLEEAMDLSKDGLLNDADDDDDDYFCALCQHVQFMKGNLH
jgi:hypothetical protein